MSDEGKEVEKKGRENIGERDERNDGRIKKEVCGRELQDRQVIIRTRNKNPKHPKVNIQPGAVKLVL